MSNLFPPVLTVSEVHTLHALKNVRGGRFELLRQNFVNISIMPYTPENILTVKVYISISEILQVYKYDIYGSSRYQNKKM